MTNQFELTTTFSIRPQQFAWLIGAGCSAVAGLPTAWDILWDLKRRYYCREENQEILRQDVQMGAIRTRIQSYMLSRGFPEEGDPNEYTTYFEKIFGEDRERQRQYLTAMLSEDRVTLSVGNRVLGALLATDRTRAVFTTNFDSVVERAVAEVSGRSLAAYHLEGAASANKAISNEEFPFYCKLHGDFRYDSIRNLRSDLAAQNEDLSASVLNAANRFGLIVAGYSGRDDSVMSLLRSALKTHNPFPHGVFWTGMKGAPVLSSVKLFIEEARHLGVNASFVEVETFDAFMLRLWRNIDSKDAAIDAKVRKSHRISVNIPRAPIGKGPIVRMNALPIVTLPLECQSLSFESDKEWSELRAATNASKGQLIFTKADTVLCWGQQDLIQGHFKEVSAITRYNLKDKIDDISRNQQIKGFLEEAICYALARGRPLLARSSKAGSFLIADAYSRDQSIFAQLHKAVGKPFGQVVGIFTAVDDEHPHPEKIHFSEALRISLDFIDGQGWLLLDPDVWIWPPRAKRDVSSFLDERRGTRYNNIYNALLDAWITVLFGEDRAPSSSMDFSPFNAGSSLENPTFNIGTRTAYTQRLVP